MRLIDADTLFNKLDHTPWYDNADRDEIALPAIDGAPIVGAVPVVRCKDCRYRGMIFCPAVHETMGNGLMDYTSDGAYCWRGRPKEVNDALD